MRPALILILFVAWGGAAWADPPCNCVEPPVKEFQATVQRVSDGDTLVVRTSDFEDIKIRLYGIDAPERGQEGGPEATAALRPLQGRQVTIKEMDTDRYSRMVALVEHQGQCVNLDLVRQGLVWHYRQYCKVQPLCGEIEAAENEARTAGRGLWARGKPVAPWEWRRKK
jgi:endonuclease YncB( thermonuclease family)